MQTKISDVLEYLKAIGENEKFDTGTRLMFLGVHGMLLRALIGERETMEELIDCFQQVMLHFDVIADASLGDLSDRSHQALTDAKAIFSDDRQTELLTNSRRLEEMSLSVLYELVRKAIASGATKTS